MTSHRGKHAIAALPSHLASFRIIMKIRTLLPVFCVAGLICAAIQPAAAVAQATESLATESLGIGSKAPSLDIEHWLQDGGGNFKEVTDFEDEKVYVVEFWATWCGPCISSMPHLAELQNQYRDSVQIISVSDETVDEVNDLMGKEHPQAGKTFQEITSAYSLTTDPDRSVHEAYMEAANQNGIPTAFIVGKTGLIEWIGHPGNMDEPLEKVVQDSWDREAFKAELRIQEELQNKMQELGQLAVAGKFDEALALADEQIAGAANETIKEHWTAVRFSMKISKGDLDDETLAFYRDQIEQIKDDPISLTRFGYSLYGISQQGADINPLAADAIKALDAVADDVPESNRVLYYNTLALLNDSVGSLDAAIRAMEKAVEFADDRQKKRMMPMLEELKAKAEKESADDK